MCNARLAETETTSYSVVCVCEAGKKKKKNARQTHVHATYKFGLFFFSQCFQFATDNGTDLLKHEKELVFFKVCFHE